MRHLVLILGILFTVSAGNAEVTEQKSEKVFGLPLFEKLAPCVVILSQNINISVDTSVGKGMMEGTQDNIGTGIIIAEHLILTCKHEVPGNNTCHIFYYPDGEGEGDVIWRSTKVDLALLEVKQALPKERIAIFAKENPTICDIVFTIGTPTGIGWCFNEGYVMQGPGNKMWEEVAKENPDIELLFFMSTEHGQSGSPICNKSGELVSMVRLKPGSTTCAGITIKGIRHFLEEFLISYNKDKQTSFVETGW